MRLDVRAHEIGRELGDRAAMEHLALDRAALHDDANVAVERVDARLEERMDRRRDDDLAVAAVLAHHREHLLDVERVPGRGGRDALPQVAASSGASATRRSMSSAHSSAPSGSSRSDVAFSLPPPQPGRSVEELGARDAEQEDRRVAREVGDVLDEVDEDRLGPLQVVDHDDLRPLGRARLEQPPEGELRLGRRRADDGVGLDADRDQDLDERPVGDPLAVGEAAAAQDVGRVADALEEVGDEARLADAGRAEEREEPARAVGDGVLVVAPEPLTLALAADERRLEVARERRGVADHLEEPERLDRLGLPLQRERLDRLDADGVADEQPRLGADERSRRRRPPARGARRR